MNLKQSKRLDRSSQFAIISLAAAVTVEGGEEIANYYHENVFAPMLDIRAAADELEPMISEKYLTYPTYGQLLFGVN